MRQFKGFFVCLMLLLLVGCAPVVEERTVNYGESIELSSESLAKKDKLQYVLAEDGVLSFENGTDEFEGLNPVVTGMLPGRTCVTVSEGDKEIASFNVTVELVPITEIILSTNEITITEGEIQELSYTLLPGNASDYGLYWKSADTTVASIDEMGVVTANKVGQTTIIISSEQGEIVEKCSVTVEQKCAYDRLSATDKEFVDMFLEHIRSFKDPYTVRITGIERLTADEWCVGVSGTNGFGGASSSNYLIADGAVMNLKEYSFLAIFDDSYDLNLINEALQEKIQ